MRLLFIGDIVARPGREVVRRGLKTLVRAHHIDFVLANVENAAGGAGVTREIADELFGLGIDVLTSGNHIWDKREVLTFIGEEPRLLRPANYPAGAPGSGAFIAKAENGELIGVVNVMGRVFLANIDDPFSVAAREVARLRAAGARTILVDFHAEATSEKLALGWHVDGTVTAVIGTHTHVQTADEHILPGGTAYITDVGMTGAHDGIIGMERTAIISRFITGLPARIESATGDLRLHAVVIEAEAGSGRALGITRVGVTLAELDAMNDAARQPAASLT
ncbi:MAG TPA: TIGR00282 family metallophosphoesterase [Vicinamibacterales bacterium]|nr:TIGR00282 family metallophosphoesterase [Vicinamibacterales bacterium]